MTSSPIFKALNLLAEIYGRTPLSPAACTAFQQATGIQDESLLVNKLSHWLKTSDRFPLPLDFRTEQS
ncbi:hypothetical protein [Comamonas odontotermitis]|uniref:hypothetical protein n=1 Tax=Comamonas odontotermitis TaxID=379895 RepID=UPI001CC5E142|nr:hypothetical protein [Comamonas odontotermitis]UBB15463.1 hypothetical protein LAD35_11310 [Comamonas odontotermitis]